MSGGGVSSWFQHPTNIVAERGGKCKEKKKPQHTPLPNEKPSNEPSNHTKTMHKLTCEYREPRVDLLDRFNTAFCTARNLALIFSLLRCANFSAGVIGPVRVWSLSESSSPPSAALP
jgi:hypothetical protein